MVVANEEVLDTDDEKVRGKHEIGSVELKDIKAEVENSVDEEK